MTAGWRSGSRQESPGKKKRPRGLKRPGSPGMAAPTGEYSHGWGSSDPGWGGSCSGKGTREGGPTGEYSHGWGSSDAGWDGSCVLGVRQCAWRKCHAELRLGMEPLSG